MRSQLLSSYAKHTMCRLNPFPTSNLSPDFHLRVLGLSFGQNVALDGCYRLGTFPKTDVNSSFESHSFRGLFLETHNSFVGRSISHCVKPENEKLQ